MSEPGDEIAAGTGGRSQLRASHAEREQVIDLLKAAFAQGRLAMDEFDLRVGWALTSRTCAELGALTADIPAGLTGARPPQPTRESGNKKTTAVVMGSIAVWWSTQVAVSLWVGASGRPMGLLILIIAAVLLQVSILSAWLIAVRLGRRASRRSAPGLSPGNGSQASQRPKSAAWARQLPQTNRCCRMVPPRRCWLARRPAAAAADPDRGRPRAAKTRLKTRPGTSRIRYPVSRIPENNTGHQEPEATGPSATGNSQAEPGSRPSRTRSEAEIGELTITHQTNAQTKTCCARRVGNGDVEALALMIGLAEEIETAIAEAVKGLRTCGYSWSEIGSRLGISRQAAQQRWGTSG